MNWDLHTESRMKLEGSWSQDCFQMQKLPVTSENSRGFQMAGIWVENLVRFFVVNASDKQRLACIAEYTRLGFASVAYLVL